MSATKIVKGLMKMEYEERLRRLKMTMLENRRLRGDMIEMWKILNSREDIDSSQFFQMATCSHNLRRTQYKIIYGEKQVGFAPVLFQPKSSKALEPSSTACD